MNINQSVKISLRANCNYHNFSLKIKSTRKMGLKMSRTAYELNFAESQAQDLSVRYGFHIFRHRDNNILIEPGLSLWLNLASNIFVINQANYFDLKKFSPKSSQIFCIEKLLGKIKPNILAWKTFGQNQAKYFGLKIFTAKSSQIFWLENSFGKVKPNILAWKFFRQSQAQYLCCKIMLGGKKTFVLFQSRNFRFFGWQRFSQFPGGNIGIGAVIPNRIIFDCMSDRSLPDDTEYKCIFFRKTI